MGRAMWITRADAVDMYARFFLARYGELALKRASARAQSLAVVGDFEGQRIWNEVAEVIDTKQNRSEAAPHFVQ